MTKQSQSAADQVANQPAVIEFVSPKKPATLQFAEHSLRSARRARAETDERLRAAIAVVTENRNAPESPVRAAAADVAEIDEKIRALRTALTAERDDFLPAFRKAAAPAIAEAAAEILAGLDRVDVGLAALRKVSDFGRTNGLPNTRLVDSEPNFRRMSNDMRRTISKKIKVPK